MGTHKDFLNIQSSVAAFALLTDFDLNYFKRYISARKLKRSKSLSAGHAVSLGVIKTSDVTPQVSGRRKCTEHFAKFITKTCPCNILQYFTAVKMIICI